MVDIGRYISYDIEGVLVLEVLDVTTDYEFETSLCLTLEEYKENLNVLNVLGFIGIDIGKLGYMKQIRAI